MKKQALIVANLAGFASFLISDIDILKNMGYDITYVANGNVLPWDDTKKKLLDRNVNIFNVDFDSKNPFSKNNRKAYKQLKNILKNKTFDLIHCHTPISGFLTRIAARKYRRKGTKVIYTTHGFAFSQYSSKKSYLLYYNFEKFASRFCDAIITINKEDYKAAKGMKCKNVFYIPGVGVDLSKYHDIDIDINKYKNELGIDSKKIMILSIGELSERKNHKVIIEALSKLHNKQDYCYVICGNGVDGGTGKMLKKLAEDNDIDLHLLGFRKDIPEIIKCSDIGALPSIREGLGLAGIQSLALGVPVVASNVQGIKDYIIDNKTGYLCNPFKKDDFTDSIMKLSDKETRKKMQDFCKDIAKKFDIKVSENQREHIYQQLLKNI